MGFSPRGTSRGPAPAETSSAPVCALGHLPRARGRLCAPLALKLTTQNAKLLYFQRRFGTISFKLGVNVIGVWEDIRSGFDFTALLNLLLGVIPSLVCITLHELSHGLVAYRLGDPTAKDAGRLTLNPLKHLDPMGLLMMLLFHVGWAKPVPVNMNRLKNPRRDMAIVALAGPLCNVLIAVVFFALYGALFVPLRENAAGKYALEMLLLTVRISLGLAIFNLIPVPPLDGSKILLSLLPDEGYRFVLRYERYGSLALFALVALGVLSKPLSFAINAAYTALIPVAQAAMNLVVKLFYT